MGRMNARRKIAGRAAGLLVAAAAGLLFSQERLRLTSADRMVGETESGRPVRKLIGRVRMVQGEAFLECEEAVWWEKEDRVRLVREVRIYDGKRTLFADEVVSNAALGLEQAIGHAKLTSCTRTLFADHIEYWSDSELAAAKGHAAAEDRRDRLRIEADELQYDRKKDYALARGNPRAVRIDTSSTRHDWTVRGVKMESWGGDRRLLVTDSVAIAQGDLHAFCQSAEYRFGKDLLFLRISPRVVQPNRSMASDSMEFRLQDTRFMGGTLAGKASIVSKDSIGREDELKGSRIFIHARGDTLDSLIVEDQAESAFHVSDESGRGDEGVRVDFFG